MNIHSKLVHRSTRPNNSHRAVRCSEWIQLGLFAFFFGFMTCGCTSIQLHANKDAASVRRVKRLFVLIQHGDIGTQPYSTDLAEAIRTAFTNTPVVTEVGVSNPIELDERVHRQQIEKFESDAVLVITATGGIVAEFGGYPTIIYDASLFEPQMDKRLWRARIDNSGGTAFMKRRFREMAEHIIRQLRSDGFI